MPTPCDPCLNIQRQLVLARHHYNDRPVYGDLAGRMEVEWSHPIWDRTYFAIDAIEQALALGRYHDSRRVNMAWAFPEGVKW